MHEGALGKEYTDAEVSCRQGEPGNVPPRAEPERGTGSTQEALSARQPLSGGGVRVPGLSTLLGGPIASTPLTLRFLPWKQCQTEGGDVLTRKTWRLTVLAAVLLGVRAVAVSHQYSSRKRLAIAEIGRTAVEPKGG